VVFAAGRQVLDSMKRLIKKDIEKKSGKVS
jgi:hypothetical protein